VSSTHKESDVSLIVTAGRKQNNRKKLQQNLKRLSDLLQSNQILVSLDAGSGEEAVSDHNIDFQDVENDSFENMFEMANMNQMLNVLGNEHSDDGIKHLLKLKQLTKYALFYRRL